MNYLPHRSLYVLLLSIFVASCQNKSIVGRWKIDHLTYINGKVYDPINLNDKDSLFTVLKRAWGKQYNDQQIDSLVYLIQHSFLTIDPDHTFNLIDAGSLIRDPDGFFVKGRANGKWKYSKKDQILRLDFSPETFRRYKIINVDDSSIILRELFKETNSPVTEVNLIRR
jgi:hypothetical protein